MTRLDDLRAGRVDIGEISGRFSMVGLSRDYNRIDEAQEIALPDDVGSSLVMPGEPLPLILYPNNRALEIWAAQSFSLRERILNRRYASRRQYEFESLPALLQDRSTLSEREAILTARERGIPAVLKGESSEHATLMIVTHRLTRQFVSSEQFLPLERPNRFRTKSRSRDLGESADFAVKTDTRV